MLAVSRRGVVNLRQRYVTLRVLCSRRQGRGISSCGFGYQQSWQQITSFNAQSQKQGKDMGKPCVTEELSQEISDGYRRFQSEEMALLTDDPHSLPLLESILNCPMKLEDWNKVTKNDRSHLSKISAVFDSLKLPSVSKILHDTASPLSKIILNKWKKKKTEELGEEGFKEYMNTLTNEGKTFHKAIEDFLKCGSTNIAESGQWKSISSLLEKVSSVECLENTVSHPFLSYHGRLDCVARYNNNLCLFDWKLSTTRKETLKKCYDDPFQVAAYVGAFNLSNDTLKQVSNAVVVKAYRDGTPADVHFMNEFVLEFYWESWLRRLARHHTQIVNSSL